MTLYEITDDYMQLLDMMSSDDVDDQAIKDTWESLTGSFEDKADAYAKVLEELDIQTVAIDKEIARLRERKAGIERTQERLKHNLMQAMIYTGQTKFKTALYTFGIQKNPPSVQIADDAKVPRRFLIQQEPKVDKKAILEELKAGKKFKWATLTQGERLSVR